MNYLDLYVNEEETKPVMVPVDIHKEEILTISPAITSTGKQFKNVSFLKDRYGNSYKVVGNYKQLIEIIKGKENKIGYK